MAGPSNIWEEDHVARAELGFGGMIPDEAAEEGRVSNVKGNMKPLQSFKQNSDIIETVR